MLNKFFNLGIFSRCDTSGDKQTLAIATRIFFGSGNGNQSDCRFGVPFVTVMGFQRGIKQI